MPLRTTIAASAIVPTPKETSAAGRLPVALPSPALIGAWIATSPPAQAVSRTAAPLSTAIPRRGVIFVESRVSSDTSPVEGLRVLSYQ